MARPLRSLLLAALLSIATGASAATFIVNSSGSNGDANPGDGICEDVAGSGVCTLRAAIEEANALASVADTIVLPSGTISLTTQIEIASDITIVGQGVGVSILSGTNTGRIFEVGRGTVTIRDLTLRDGRAFDSSGGAVRVLDGNVTLERVAFFANTSRGANGYGGALMVVGGNVTIRDSLFDGNLAENGGGAMRVLSGASVTIERSLFSGNLVGQFGGGGAIETFGSVTIVNSTFAGNLVPAGTGAAIQAVNPAEVTIRSSTIARNSTAMPGAENFYPGGGQLYAASTQPGTGGLFYIYHSIVADSVGSTGNCLIKDGAAISSTAGYNIESANTCNFGQPTDLVDTDPLLGPLQNNGGPTPTISLLAGSKAIDRIPSGAIGVDQRGVARPIDGDGVPGALADVGALESDPPVPGACGSANGVATLAAPAANLCSAGTASAVTPGSTSFTWTCAGAGTGSTANCSAPRQYPVLASPGSNGGLNCTSPVTAGQTTTCTATPASGYRTQSISGCGGTPTTPTVNSYTTGPISAQCTVSATFAPAPLGNVSQGGSPVGGVTVPPPGGNPGKASASFTSANGGINCAFDPDNTGFIAATAAYPTSGAILPHGMFRFRMINCEPGFTARVTVNWPSLNGLAYFKYGKASPGASDSFFVPTNLAISGSSASFDVTDGQLGDNDWTVNGQITDPTAPVRLPPPAVPTLDARGMVVLAALLLGAGLLWQRRGLRVRAPAGRLPADGR